MPFPIDISACLTDPGSDECAQTKKFFRDLLEAQYLAKFIKFPPFAVPGVRPDPPPFAEALSPHSDIASMIANQNLIVGELLINAIGDPDPAPNRPSIIDMIKKEKIHIEVVERLIRQFETGVKALKLELEVFKKK
jgi:hypothetical protein